MTLYILEKLYLLTNNDIEMLISSSDKREFFNSNPNNVDLNSIFSHYLLDLFLKTEYNLNNYEIYRNKHGKPYLKGNPLFFNISHSKKALAIAISDFETGVDVEIYGRYKPKIAKRVCSEEELSVLSSSKDEQDLLFTEFWTKKEAYSKMCGIGFGMGFEKINTPAMDGFYTLVEKEYCLSAIEKKNTAMIIKRFTPSDFL